MTNRHPQQSRTSRRAFMRASSLLFAGGAVSGPLAVPRTAHAFGSDEIRIGLVGCGRRGTQAAAQALNTAANGQVRLVAMADTFRDRLQAAYRSLNGRYGPQVTVPRDRQFVGLDAYQSVLRADIDLVILATPPAFRPLHLEHAVAADKHVFLEMPPAVDADGVGRLLAAGEEAERKGLAVACGLQKRHDPIYQETIQRLRDGAIGQLAHARICWNGRRRKTWRRPANGSELEYQIRNWWLFPWLGGDQIVEQHVGNLDVGNWLAGSCPVTAVGQCGRVADAESPGEPGLDSCSVEFTYASDFRLFSQSRCADDGGGAAGEFVYGTMGTANLTNGRIYDRHGGVIWQRNGRHDGWQGEQRDLFHALRSGKRPNETALAAASTMTAIMGRLAVEAQQAVTWEDARFTAPLAAADHLHSMRDEDYVNGRCCRPRFR